MKPLRLSVFLPRPTGFYRGLLPQMLAGFEAAGFEADGTFETLDEAGVLSWCRERKTDVVFDMNRTRSQLPDLPRHVRHITWIVDYLGRTDDQIKGSDITYFFTTGWVSSFPHASFVDWFPPGSCTDTYAPNGAPFESDAAVAGHVPPPWSQSELTRNVSRTERAFSFGELLPQFQAWVQGLRDDDEATHSSYWAAANRIVRSATGDDIIDDPTIRYDLLGRLPRTGLRQSMVSEVLSAGCSLRIFGTKGWTAWPELAPHYRGFLEQPSDLARAYASSRFNLHEGEGMHFRSMDCLATGGLLFYCTKRKSIDLNGGWHSVPFGARVNDRTRPLVAGRHYVEYYPGELAQKASYYLARPALCDRLRQNARDAIREGHTWRHRAQKVAADLAAL